MAPNTTESINEEVIEKVKAPQAEPRDYKIVYRNLVTFGYWHIAALYGLYLCWTSAKWATIFFGFILYVIAEIGVTAGAHRLWAHKAYKAKLPLQILLMFMNSIAFQNTIMEWVRDHRLHHKHSDTDADPHNATRGFFYSHVGWLLVRKHEKVKRKGKELDMSDIYGNPVLRFQKKYAIPFIGLICFVLPTVIPMFCWGESLSNAWHITMLRYVVNLNVTFSVNSASHLWGYKPYDKSILPAQNLFSSVTTFGEGFHNFHHVFPWDYRAAELGNNWLNLTAVFIDFFAKIGWAYDLKSVPYNLVKTRMERTGDGTNLWGWDDKEMSTEDQNATMILFKKEGNINDDCKKYPKVIRHKLYYFVVLHNIIVLLDASNVTLSKDPTYQFTVLKTLRYSGSEEVKLGELPHHVLFFKLYNKWNLMFRAFCAGSIITSDRVLTSANCFLTNRKRYKRYLSKVKVVAGILTTVAQEPVSDDTETQQWRSVDKIYSQRFYRFPAYDLAILHTSKPWQFNRFVNKIPYASKVQYFDGVCMSTSVKATKSWSLGKYLFAEQLQLIRRWKCERMLLRNCRLYYCTVSIKKDLHSYSETEGGGLVCHGTGDPEEVDEKQGILVGVTSVINVGLPSLHTRVGLFNKWVTDGSCMWNSDGVLVIMLLIKLL